MDFASRIDDLCDHLTNAYGVDDRDLVEIFLSALVNCPRTPSLWFILEASFHAPKPYGAWFSFGEHWLPRSLEELRGRMRSWRKIDEEFRQYLEDESDQEHLFVEPEWERHPKFNRHQAAFLIDRSLRVRHKPFRTDKPIQVLDHIQRDLRTDKNAYLTRKILEDPLNSRPVNPPKFHPPDNFLYHTEIMQRLAPWYRDWEVLVTNLGALAIRHAYLLGRDETNEEEVEILRRVARDSVPPWIVRAIRKLEKGPSKAPPLEAEMRLRYQTQGRHGSHYELTRLRKKDMIRWDNHKLHWAMNEEHRAAILEILGA
jgi:hypothetical protein